MTGFPSGRPKPASERGMALIAALLLMMVMSGLAIALLASGRIETAMGDNEELYAGARAASEAGLNHTAAIILQLTADPVFPLNSLLNGPDTLSNPATNDATSVNADNGSVTQLLGGTAPWQVEPGSAYSYAVQLMDDDDPALKGGVAFTNVELTAMGANSALDVEDGLRFNDVNGRLVIRSTGFGPRGTQATLEQMLVPIEMPALLVNGNVTLAGNTRIQGDQGSVHANGTLHIQNGSVTVAEDATSTGTLTAPGGWDPGGLESGGMPIIPVPNILAFNYRTTGDFFLHADGRITSDYAGTNLVCTAAASANNCRNEIPYEGTANQGEGIFGLVYSNASQSWTLNPGSATDPVNEATYYAFTDFSITGHTAPSLSLSVIAEGDIIVTGNPDLQPEPESQIQFVTNMDLKITGDLAMTMEYAGHILVREQIDFFGNGSMVGQVVCQNVPSVSTLVTGNVVSGNFELTYDGGLEPLAYTVSGWRETQ
jgi:hypothetical protein